MEPILRKVKRNDKYTQTISRNLINVIGINSSHQKLPISVKFYAKNLNRKKCKRDISFFILSVGSSYALDRKNRNLENEIFFRSSNLQ
jgi:hypothetical protein